MALTAEDLTRIRHNLVEVIEPRLNENNGRLEETDRRIDARFTDLKSDINHLADTTNRKFHAAFTDISILREDLHVVKQMVTEHGFRIAGLEHKAPGQDA